MTARPPLEQIVTYSARAARWGYDHPDYESVLNLAQMAAEFVRDAEALIARMEDAELRADLLDPMHGLGGSVADGISVASSFMSQWDDRRADRAREAEDNRAADAADARLTW